MRVVSHAFLTEFPLGLQVIQDISIDRYALLAQRAEGFSGPGSQAMLFHGLAEAQFVDVQVLFAGDVPGDFQGQPISGVEVEGLNAWQDLLLLGSQPGQQVFEFCYPTLHGALEAGLLPGDVVQDGGAVTNQFRVETAIVLDDRHGDLCQEGLL